MRRCAHQGDRRVALSVLGQLTVLMPPDHSEAETDSRQARRQDTPRGLHREARTGGRGRRRGPSFGRVTECVYFERGGYKGCGAVTACGACASMGPPVPSGAVPASNTSTPSPRAASADAIDGETREGIVLSR
jgi:hypothetical protein